MDTVIASYSAGEGDEALAKLRVRLNSATPAALDAAALVLRQYLSAELSMPGTGRFYPKYRQGGSGDASKRRGFNSKLRKAVGKANAAGGTSGIAKAQILRMHRASLPNTPPAADTGNLKRSLFVERTGPLSRSIGVAALYALPLEFGTARVLPRPFMRPAVKKALAAMRDAFGKALAVRRG